MGHPFTDAAIHYCGSVDFGGFAVCRRIKCPSLSGLRGLHCNFIVKLTKSTPDGETMSFDLAPILITQDGAQNEKAADLALRSDTSAPSDGKWADGVDLAFLYDLAQKEVLKRYQGQGVWDEDISCLNAALVDFE